MNGVWVVWLEAEGWGGLDNVVNHRAEHQAKYPKLTYDDRLNVTFVPWGRFALEQEESLLPKYAHA